MAKNRPKHAPPKFNRVYFIGAGLSAGMRYPIGQTLMSRLVSYLRGDPEAMDDGGTLTNSVHDSDGGPAHAAEILRVMERVLKRYFATPLSSIDRVDVTEFFTLAQSLSERSWLVDSTTAARRRASSNTGTPSETTLFADLAAVTRSYFLDLSPEEYPDDIYNILDLVRPDQDAVINFNWDEEVDIFFSSAPDENVSYTLCAWQNAADSNETLILKPHGSIGWYDLQRGIGNEEAYLIAMRDERIARQDKRIVAYAATEMPVDMETDESYSPLACPPVLTPPTFAKRFDYVEQQRIWRDVLEVCGNAKEFVFLGYSLPKDDFLTRAAIRAAIALRRNRERIRCLVVDRTFEDTKRLNFLSVFDGLSPDRNHLRWSFGSDGSTIAEELTQKLSRAFVGSI